MSGQYGSNISVVLTDLSNGATASYNETTQFVSASIYKLYVAYGIYQQIDAGELALTSSITVNGETRTVDSCLDSMLTVSDNNCAIALGKLYGWAALDTMLANAGYSHTTLNNYSASGVLLSYKQTTASDVAKLLQALYDGTLLSDFSTKSFIAYLRADEISYMLPSGLPDGTVVAHKVGYLEDYQHDAGIIYSSNKDMLVVMLTKGWQTSPTAEAAAAFTQLGQAVWAYIET